MKRVLCLFLIIVGLCSCSSTEIIPFNSNETVIWAAQPELQDKPITGSDTPWSNHARGTFLSNGMVLFSEIRNNVTYTGLTDRAGNVLLDADYYRYGYLPHGYLLLNSDTDAILIGPTGEQVKLGNRSWICGTYSTLTNDAMLTDTDSLYFPIHDTATGEYLFIDRFGSPAFDRTYEHAYPFSEGLAAVKIDGLYGFIGSDGQMVISPRFLEASSFFDGLAVIKDSNAYAMIDVKGELLFSWDWDYLSPCKNGAAVFSNNGGYGLVSCSGDILLPAKYDSISRYEGNFVVKENGEISLYNMNTHSLLPFYDSIMPVTPSMAITTREGKYGLLSISLCQEIVAPYLYLASYLGEGVFYGSKDGKSAGFIDTSGNWLIEYNDDLLPPIDDRFKRGTLPVCYRGKWGLLANPLLYPSWEQDELSRASFVGIYPKAGEPLTLAAAADIMVEVGDYRNLLFKQGVLPAQSGAVVTASTFHEVVSKRDSSIITRADAAVLFYTLAKQQGEITDNYLCCFSDTAECTDFERGAIAYIMSMNLFDSPDSAIFNPSSAVSETEMAIAAVRFIESTIDIPLNESGADTQAFSKYLN